MLKIFDLRPVVRRAARDCRMQNVLSILEKSWKRTSIQRERSSDLSGTPFSPMSGDELVEASVRGRERVGRSERVTGPHCFGNVALALPQG